MKIFPVIGLIILTSACSDVESEIKDMRDSEPKVEQKSPEVINTPDKTETSSEVKSNDVTTEHSEWTYKVVFISEKNWGYQLFQNGTMMINQTTIPSVQGIKGFDSQEKADRTAKHILTKLEKGIFPPTVNQEELENLGVLRD